MEHEPARDPPSCLVNNSHVEVPSVLPWVLDEVLEEGVRMAMVNAAAIAYNLDTFVLIFNDFGSTFMSRQGLHHSSA